MTLRFTQGNLLDAEAEALVNTVNTVGVMGKGIALMFKEHFPDNFRTYLSACKTGSLHVGEVLSTRVDRLGGPRWVINFPTKQHWRNPSQLDWIETGLQSLRTELIGKGIRSVAVPPLGAGNGGLRWAEVKPRIEAALADLPGVEVIVYEPTREYQNVRKTKGVERLTPARALVAELVRRYSIVGIECSLLEVQKLCYFLQRVADRHGAAPSLGFAFQAHRYGPYAPNLAHLLDALDGSYLHCSKRLADAGPFDPIHFEDAKRDQVSAYLTTPEAKPYLPALHGVTQLIDGFESPLGLELLGTVDWAVTRQGAAPSLDGVHAALRDWPGGDGAAERKLRLFDDRLLGLALVQLQPFWTAWDSKEDSECPTTPT